jgi:Na+-transporting NADH:ubiquinone oxidoreductase subunit A
MLIRIKKGLDIPVDGAPVQVISDHSGVSSVALLGNDYVGLSPSMRVGEGDRVKLGQPLFTDRRHPDVMFTAPASGVVAEINRGARRALLSVVVRLDGDEAETFPAWPAEDLGDLRPDQVTETLLNSGLWTALRARPYGKLVDPAVRPRSIFVTAIDTNPLAARPEAIIDEYAGDFANGLIVVSHLTDGTVFLCKAPTWEVPAPASSKVSVVDFAGPHPSGLVGTHIHILDPVGAKEGVWHLNHQDVIAIGKLFATGRLWTDRVVALAGPVVKRPRLVRTRVGANTDEVVAGELEEGDARVISGSFLSGRWARRPENYLGRFHTQISVVDEARAAQSARSLGSGRSFSSQGLLPRFKPSQRKFAFSTALHGRPTAMVPLGGFERVTPLDILPTQLLRALLVGDSDMAQALGCLELDEEDLALCTFVCPSKIDYGLLLRATLARIEKEG